MYWKNWCNLGSNDWNRVRHHTDKFLLTISVTNCTVNSVILCSFLKKDFPYVYAFM